MLHLHKQQLSQPSRKCTRSSWKPHVLLLNHARDRKKYHCGIPDFHILDYQFKCFHFLLQGQMQHFDWLNLTYHCLELLRKRVTCGVLLLPLTPYCGPYRQATQVYAAPTAQIFHQDAVKNTTSHTSHQHCHSQHPATILSTNYLTITQNTCTNYISMPLLTKSGTSHFPLQIQ